VCAIAINNSYLLAPWADVCYFADAYWWAEHRNRPAFIDFAGEKCTIRNFDRAIEIQDAAVHMLRNFHVDINGREMHGHGLSNDPGALVTGRHSSYQALNLAILAGAKTIILLGMDGRPAPNGKTHWHAGHKEPTPQEAYAEYRKSWSAGENAIEAAGVRVINASPGSGIDSFEKMPLSEALESLAKMA
jgi:hypothetical protein